MIRKLLLPALAALALAGCGEAPKDEAVPPGALPALWEVASADGEVEGWLFGTIHALPDGVSWRSETLEDVIDRADVLVVEVAGLDDPETISRVFSRLAFDEPVPTLAARVEPVHAATLRQLRRDSVISTQQFDRMESWAAALTLAQVTRTSDPANGADKALMRDFAARDIRELEGAAKQLAIFDDLPESEQRDLLNSSIEASITAEADTRRLTQAWRSGDVGVLADITTEGLLADPELHEALLANRNRDWAEQLDPMLKSSPRLLIAVGAGHMVGEAALPALLEERGYTVRRIQ